jgi:Domain of unknown function (DUF5658)
MKTVKRIAERLNLRSQIILIALLNIADGILTYISVSEGYAVEKNPIVQAFIENPGMVLLWKILLPSLLLAMSYLLITRTDVGKEKWIRWMISGTLAVYVFLFINHLFVLTQYALMLLGWY